MAPFLLESFQDYWTKYLCQHFCTKNSYELTVSPPSHLTDTSSKVRLLILELKEALSKYNGSWILFPEFAEGRLHFHGYLKTPLKWPVLKEQRSMTGKALGYVCNIDIIKCQHKYIQYVMKDWENTCKILLSARPLKSDDISLTPRKWYHDLYNKLEFGEVFNGDIPSCRLYGCDVDHFEDLVPE